MMSAITGSVRNNGRSTAHRARASRPASDRLRKQATKVTADIKELGGIAGAAAQEKLGQWRDNASAQYAEGQERVHQAERTFEQLIGTHPVKSLLIAAGVGLLLGRLWMRR
jgi:ElaB/YqjD/DUF883 family membrane-anchored ribosome-binding protein